MKNLVLNFLLNYVYVYFWGAKKFQHINLKKSKYGDLDEDDFNKIDEKMNQLNYQLPEKVFVMQENVKKPPFYIIYLPDLLKICEGNFIFKEFYPDSVAEN